jgi:hypothetical protein
MGVGQRPPVLSSPVVVPGRRSSFLSLMCARQGGMQPRADEILRVRHVLSLQERKAPDPAVHHQSSRRMRIGDHGPVVTGVSSTILTQKNRPDGQALHRSWLEVERDPTGTFSCRVGGNHSLRRLVSVVCLHWADDLGGESLKVLFCS